MKRVRSLLELNADQESARDGTADLMWAVFVALSK